MQFHRAVTVLAQAGHDVFVEVSPHPVLAPVITAPVVPRPVVTGTLRRDDGGPDRFLTAIATLHTHGVTVDWTTVLPTGNTPPSRPTPSNTTTTGTPPEPNDAGPTVPDTGAGALRRRLAGRSAAARDAILLDLVRAHVAAVLGHASIDAIDPRSTLRDLGVDSVTAVELPRRLNGATGLRLPDTVSLRLSTPVALSSRLGAELANDDAAPTAAPPTTAVGRQAAPATDGPRRPRRRWTSRSRSWASAAAFPARSAAEDLWELVAGGATRSAIPHRPRLGPRALFGPDGRPGPTYVRHGGFIYDAGRVRRRHSSGSPRARRWRWIRSSGCCWRCAWEALEHGGHRPGRAARQSAPACSPASTARTTARGCTRAPRRPRATA